VTDRRPDRPSTDTADPAAQERYQVRFDIGLDGARRIGGSAHLLVWCDAIATEPVPVDALPHRLEVVDARLGAAAAIAQRLLALQAERVDATSPEAAAAAAAFQGLRGAVGHMLTASVAGRALAETAGADALPAARARLEQAELVVLREFSHSA